MKNYFLISIFSLIFLVACSEEYLTPNIEEANNTEGEELVAEVSQDDSLPCDFDFNTAITNDTLNIACSHDLNGENIFLPPNVIVNYAGGEIINGSLIFEEGGIIDGRLLNYQLEVSGKVNLLNGAFQFDKTKWNITEGKVSDEVALVNKNSLQKAINDVKFLGGDIFEIDKLDAYFLVTSERNLFLSWEASIRIPSDFTLQMTSNTFIRVQPNFYNRYTLLGIRSDKNIIIIGGNLIGDRDNHDYTPQTVNNHEYKTHEWGHLIDIATGVNISIQGVNMFYACGDGLNIHSVKFAFDPDYTGSNNISISNCTFDTNRRNNLSITDGYNIIIENNTFLNAGIDTEYSKGTAPRFGIDIEAYRERDSLGNLIEFQIAKDITIKNNIEKGSAGSAFSVAIGQDVPIEDNITENTLGFSLANGIKIVNNTINSTDDDTAISGGTPKNSETIFNNEISGNTILNAGTGIYIKNQDVKVYNNTIENCTTGILINDLVDSEIFNNTISSSLTNCYGIFMYIANANNVQIKNNYFNIKYKAMAFVNVNIESGNEDNTIVVSDNEIYAGKVSIYNSNGVIIDGNNN